MVQALVNLIFYIIGLISSIILSPIMAFLSALFPDISTYSGYISDWINNYVLRYVAFGKSLFMNATGFPQFLFDAVIAYLLIKISLHVFMKTWKFTVKMWRLFKP